MRPADEHALYAEHALRAYGAMHKAFATFGGRFGRDGLIGRLGVSAHLWPFIRAYIALLDLSGVEERYVPGLDTATLMVRQRRALERYWERRSPGAYSSDPVPLIPLGRLRIGGDRYHDDNAWVALALIQQQRMYPGTVDLERIDALWRFAVAGWDRRPSATPPGGVFWVEQGRGAGSRNHDRNTVSCAPNAQVGLHLAELRPDSPSLSDAFVGPGAMFTWPQAHLDASGDGRGLFYDKIRGDGSVDKAQWTYNQGSMIGAAVLLARRGLPEYLGLAEETARRALKHYAGGALERQPAEFNAILFRNLLLLHDATHDEGLRRAIRATFIAYVDWLWKAVRDPADRFRFSNRGFTLLGQSGVVQILALLAWDPARYGLLA